MRNKTRQGQNNIMINSYFETYIATTQVDTFKCGHP